ncbi:holo-ACP synthase [Kitasatospora kifunensis]|uniref:Holo-[acyl-carrier-protein] synthase n=1 Tax=Kitasatospora kifunensis TaxID=58351 RepID=A0A7W7R8I0_KITKI|nr:holo-ACP synthase [Kitasatospora kifunensis]MBB4927407.1 holo-[acyl-carrier protein] synthase [Kitasatospora kifunensis]
MTRPQPTAAGGGDGSGQGGSGGVGIRTGTDIVPTSRVNSLVRESGERFLETLLTAGEIEDCTTDRGISLDAVAARLAAKEAVFKTLHAPRSSLPWLSIEVRRTSGGWPEVELHGVARTLALEAGVAELSVSISHDGGFAIAVAVAAVRQ